MAGFRWTAKREEGALLVARDELSNDEIAKKVGISRQGLDKWKRQPEFRERVVDLVAAMAEAAQDEEIADVRERVRALNRRWKLLLRVIEERAVLYAGVPGGGGTGMLMRVRNQGSGRRGERGRGAGRQLELWDGGEGEREGGGDSEGPEFVVDGVLLRELRELERQAAQELGQWNGDRETEATVLIRSYVGVDIDEV